MAKKAIGSGTQDRKHEVLGRQIDLTGSNKVAPLGICPISVSVLGFHSRKKIFQIAIKTVLLRKDSGADTGFFQWGGQKYL